MRRAVFKGEHCGRVSGLLKNGCNEKQEIPV
jgi:hypothetical protein